MSNRPVNVRVFAMLDYLKKYYAEFGYMPTTREIMKVCKITSSSLVRTYLNILQEYDYVIVTPHISRGIQLVSKDKCPMCGSQLKGGLHAIPNASVRQAHKGIDGRKDVRDKQPARLPDVGALDFPKREDSRRNGDYSTSRQGGVIQLSKR